MTRGFGGVTTRGYGGCDGVVLGLLFCGLLLNGIFPGC